MKVKSAVQNAEWRQRAASFTLQSALSTRHSEPPGGEIASRLAYTQKSRGQNLPGRPAFAELRLGKPLPRGVIRSAPVSDTGGLGAKPSEATNSNSECRVQNA